MDVFHRDRGEFLGLAGEATGLDVNPPLRGLFVEADDEDVVGGGAEAWVVVGQGGMFVAGEDPGVVEPNAEVVGSPRSRT